MNTALALAGAYLLGSVPFSYLVARLVGRIDLRRVGSGNPGATNVLRAAGTGPAVAALALDLAKGAAPAVVGHRLGLDPGLIGGMGLAAVVGHVFPIFLRFRGGKGVATAGGFFTALLPGAGLLALLLFLAVVAWKRYVSLASMVAAAAFPLLLYLLPRVGWGPEVPLVQLVSVLLASALILFRHAENMKRLLAGTEARLGERLEARPS